MSNRKQQTPPPTGGPNMKGAHHHDDPRVRGADGNWEQASGYKFLGFILNPALCCKGTGVTSGSTDSIGTTSGSSVGSLKVGDIPRIRLRACPSITFVSQCGKRDYQGRIYLVAGNGPKSGQRTSGPSHGNHLCHRHPSYLR